MNIEEMNREVLECARYGEADDLRELLKNGADVNFKDDSGNTALHRAAANGELECLEVLKEFGAEYCANETGNYPIHWAAQNSKKEALAFLMDNYDVDVLAQNMFGRSTLTEAFDSKSTEVIELCLSHQSSSEEKLLPQPKINLENDTEKSEITDKDAVMHHFSFRGNPLIVRNILKIRELPITRANSPFGTKAEPDADTTGLGLWPASILTARWALKQWKIFDNEIVLELGAGCALPGLAIALYTTAKKVFITDIHDPTLQNAAFNMKLNATQTHETDVDNYDMSINVSCLEDNETTKEASFVEEEQSESEINVSADTASNFIAQSNVTKKILTNSKEKNTQSDANTVTSSCDVTLLKLNWDDPKTFPSEKIRIIIGSDLVYDESILAMLVKALDLLLDNGGSFLYVAPDSGRDGMISLETALASIGIHCEEKIPCPDEYYENPLVPGSTSKACGEVAEDQCSDLYILHFYDLSILKPHTLYRFRKP